MPDMSNLPPGVSENDIPGNRPEDVAEERFWTQLDERFIREYGEPAKRWLTICEDLDPDDMIWDYVRLAKDMSYEHGYNEGVAEAYMEMGEGMRKVMEDS